LYIVLAPLYLKSVRKLQEKRFVFVKILAIIIPENGAKVSKIKCFQFAQQTLSKKEFSLLLYLWENAGQIVSKESILEHVWDIDGQFVDDNTVTVNISRLKNKLGTEEIANVRGLGYIWTGKVNKN